MSLVYLRKPKKGDLVEIQAAYERSIRACKLFCVSSIFYK